ncbi:MAG TPA: ABC transporter permease [Vicinamibacterales bacterium]|nr:ABC transporter permease [Vicinamibacterales bacterium]
MLQDLRFAARLWASTPGVTLVAILSLALGIGANAAIFSVVDALGFRPLAVADEGRLVRVFGTDPQGQRGRVSYQEFRQVRDQARAFSGVMVHGMRAASVTDGRGDTEVVTADVVSGDYFTTLGIQPALGRPLRAEDEFPGSTPAVAISHALWQRRFGGDPAVVGTTVPISGTPCVLAGVMKPEFRGTHGLQAPDLWIPVETWAVLGRKGNRADFEDHSRWLDMTGRLHDGASVQQAAAETAAIASRLAAAWPDTNKDRSLRAVPEAEARRAGFAGLAVMLFAVVGVVLLIACANVAGLLLGRAEARQREIAVRRALGATRGRLVRQLLAESTLLGTLSGLVACALAWGVVRLLPALLPPMPLALGIVFQLDARVLAFTLALALLTGPLFGVAPALIASRAAPVAGLKGGQAAGRRTRRFSVRDGLVVAQVALSAVLLLGAGLLVRSLVNAQQVDLGFDRSPAIVVTLAPQLPEAREERLQFYRDLVERAAALPDARAATLTSRVPLSMFGGGATQPVVVPGSPEQGGQDPLKIRFSVVDDRYFETIGTRVVQGRAFTPADLAGPGLVVVSEAMARRHWPGGGAVGARIQVGPPGQHEDYEVIGIAQDVKQNEPTEAAQPFLYFLRGQKDRGDLTLFVRVRGNERAAAVQVKALLRAIAPGTPTLRMVTLDQHLAFALYANRVVAVLVGVLGGVGLALAMIGLYGVVAYLVSRRTREIGIRIALGATRAQVLRAVLTRDLALTAGGLALGLAGGMALGGTMRRFLFGVSTTDPWTFAWVVALVGAVALGAGYLPARRAARLDPVTALRVE